MSRNSENVEQGSGSESRSSAPTSIKFNHFLKLISPETSHFGLATKPKHVKSGLCSRRINLRKRLNSIDVGVRSMCPPPASPPARKTLRPAHPPSEREQITLFNSHGLHWRSLESGDLWYRPGGWKGLIWSCRETVCVSQSTCPPPELPSTRRMPRPDFADFDLKLEDGMG